MLRVSKLRVGYNGAVMVKGINLEIATGEAVALLGPNGAGKTTIARAIAGLIPYQGKIELESSEGPLSLSCLPAWAIARLGIVYVPETKPVFESLSVQENLRIVFAAVSLPHKTRTRLLGDLSERFGFLGQRREQKAGTLSGGEKKILAIARGSLFLQALACSSNPPTNRLLIVDEPSHGLSPQALQDVSDALRGIPISILLVEQMANFALDICSRAYILRSGEIVLSANSKDVRNHELLELYLGTSTDGRPIRPESWTKS